LHALCVLHNSCFHHLYISSLGFIFYFKEKCVCFQVMSISLYIFAVQVIMILISIKKNSNQEILKKWKQVQLSVFQFGVCASMPPVKSHIWTKWCLSGLILHYICWQILIFLGINQGFPLPLTTGGHLDPVLLKLRVIWNVWGSFNQIRPNIAKTSR